MKDYVHYVSGYFTHQDQAEDVFSKLIATGLPRNRVQIYTSHSSAHVSSGGSNQVLKKILIDGTIGAGVGAAVGLLVEVAFMFNDVDLFAASPLIAPLVLLGWGASIGGLIGASMGAVKNSQSLSASIDSAIRNGQIVVVAKTNNNDERILARKTFKDSIGDYNEVET
jgi:hypothetical protein